MTEEGNITEAERREGVTMGDVFRTVKRRLWYILGAAVLFTVAMTLMLAFVVNPLLATYSMEFLLIFPEAGNSTYPDGAPFFYQDIVSPDFLAMAKESDEKFSGIDLNKMTKNGDITIEAEKVTENEVTRYTGRYTVTVQGSYFGSDDDAEDFIKALAKAPVTRMQEDAKQVNYTSDKEVFDSAPFEERLLLLSEEKASLLSVYDGWIGAFSETYSVRIPSGTRRLKDCRDSVAALFGESVKRDLESELEFGGYYFGDLEAYTAQLKLEYMQNEAEIQRIGEALRGSGAAISVISASAYAEKGETISQAAGLSQRLAELINRNNRIDHWVNASGNVEDYTLTEANVEKFAARLDGEFDKLNDEAAILTDVITAIYGRGMSARFDTQKVTSSGDVSTIVGAIGSFVGGLVIAAVITYVVESNRKKPPQEE